MSLAHRITGIFHVTGAPARTGQTRSMTILTAFGSPAFANAITFCATSGACSFKSSWITRVVLLRLPLGPPLLMLLPASKGRPRRPFASRERTGRLKPILLMVTSCKRFQRLGYFSCEFPARLRQHSNGGSGPALRISRVHIRVNRDYGLFINSFTTVSTDSEGYDSPGEKLSLPFQADLFTSRKLQRQSFA